ncbi:ABC transporter ATP-binding protein [Gordonia sp. ABSL11-1]|uniref:ABC transporter ATP-binding protein n=1 Tax=Gordonia sp. ABSL11-1 TaxID=3053924 RepID=UPI002572DF4C|nr:ABC transporter ATP-binding protein [Gordonia sp. ABSL11-1]MDL9948956.1 ABC transporter ATP-binding protein [Gordonia sp. ABSL11-1]
MTKTTVESQSVDASSDRAILQVDALGVRFGAFQALTDLTMEIRPGEIVGVIGPNGAGKSTLVNALAGVVEAGTGSVVLGGCDLGQARPVRRARLGLVRTFQTAQLFGSLTVRANIALAARSGSGKALDAAIGHALKVLRIEHTLDATADRLSGGQRKLVELVRALACGPRVLLLDEPVAGVPMRDRAAVLDLMRHEVAERGASILLIEHDMEFVSSVCDRLYVMNAGALIAQGSWQEISTNPAVLEAYLGAVSTPSTDVGDQKKEPK